MGNQAHHSQQNPFSHREIHIRQQSDHRIDIGKNTGHKDQSRITGQTDPGEQRSTTAETAGNT